MPQVSESAPFETQLRGGLAAGLDALDLTQTITFQAYTRVVLPIDGYVFWQPTVPFEAKGSLHFSQEIAQNEDETLGLASVLFTTTDKIVAFSAMPINTIYVASAGGFRYAFSQQQGLYEQAGIWHYFGHCIYPAMASQLLDVPGTLDPSQAVVSNSLPLWLALNAYNPLSQYPDQFANSTPQYPQKSMNLAQLYPSFMVPPNLVPPYGVIHIGEGPEDTRALQPVPYLDQNRSHWQLAADRVRVTLYGLQNNAALDFIDIVEQYSVMTDNFGLMNAPIVRDGIRTQVELQTRAMKKVIDFEISYYQARVAQVARTLIESVTIQYVTESAA